MNVLEIEEQHVKVVFVEEFKKQSLADDNLILSYKWDDNPIQITPEGLSTAEEEIVVDFTASMPSSNKNLTITNSLNLRQE